MTELSNANVVLTAQQFNPSIVSQIWLDRIGLITEADLQSGHLFSDAIAQVETDDFSLLVVPQRAQFTLKGTHESYGQTIESKLIPFVRRLPETPYRGLGLNLAWNFVPEHSSIEDVCRRLCLVPDSPVHQLFDTPDARFGSFMSKDFEEFRLRLEVRPAQYDPPDEEPRDVVLFSFNYHRPIAEEEDSVAAIVEQLGQWDRVYEETRRILQSVQGL